MTFSQVLRPVLGRVLMGKLWIIHQGSFWRSGIWMPLQKEKLWNAMRVVIRGSDLPVPVLWYDQRDLVQLLFWPIEMTFSKFLGYRTCFNGEKLWIMHQGSFWRPGIWMPLQKEKLWNAIRVVNRGSDLPVPVLWYDQRDLVFGRVDGTSKQKSCQITGQMPQE